MSAGMPPLMGPGGVGGRGVANGLATLDPSGHVPASQLPYAPFAQLHVPMVVAGCTTGTAGALTGITAQAVQWAGGYMFFTAGAIKSGIPAVGGGWYWVTLTSTVAGQVWNNTFDPTLGIEPLPPATPLAFTGAGTGAMTCPVTEIVVLQALLAANSMGANGSLITRGMMTGTNPGTGTKSLRTRLGTAGVTGTLMVTSNHASTVTVMPANEISNVGNATFQLCTLSNGLGGTSGSAPTQVQGIVDTTQNQTLTLTLQLTNTADTVALLFFDVDLRYAA